MFGFGLDDNAKEAIKIVCGLVSTQLAMFGIDKSSDVPDRARSPFSLGYIFGMLHAHLNPVSDNKDYKKTYKAFKKTLLKIFPVEGFFLSRSVRSFITNASEKTRSRQFFDGVNHGYREIKSVIEGEEQYPLGWIRYVKDTDNLEPPFEQ